MYECFARNCAEQAAVNLRITLNKLCLLFAWDAGEVCVHTDASCTMCAEELERKAT
jgi:hypothetical protein